MAGLIECEAALAAADEATLDLLKFLGRRIAGTRALLVVSYRDDEVTASHPLTRGNAFFVTEVLRDTAEPRGPVPATVQDVVLARFARLPSGVQALLHAVAVVPGRAERWLVDVLVSPTLDEIEAALASGLLVAEADSLGFRHELGRVAVESSLSPPRAQAWHARVLAALSDPARGAAPARLVHHAVQARDRGAISLQAPRAASEAAGRGSHREAHAQWQLALREGTPVDDGERTRWLDGAWQAASVLGALDEALSACQELEALARARGHTAVAALWRSRQINALIGLLRHPEALAASRHAVAGVEALPDGAEKAFVWANDALLSMLERDCGQAAQRAREATKMAAGWGDDTSRSLAQTALGASLLFVDQAAGVAVLSEQLAQRRAAGLPRLVAGSLSMMGSGLGELMNLKADEALLSESMVLAQAHEADGTRDYAAAWLSLVRMWRGEWAAAATLASAVVERTAGQGMSRLMALLALGRVRLRRGDPGVVEVLDEAQALAAPSGTLQRLGPTCAARAEAAFARGDLPAVQAEVAAALPLAQARRHPWFIGELACWQWRAGGAALAQVDHADNVENVDNADNAVCADDAHHADCAEPYALQISGRWQAAADAWQALGCLFEQARALAEGDTEAQQAALVLYDGLGAQPAADALRRQMRDAGVRGVLRGARASTRSHPCGLTSAEMTVLALMAQDLRNADIAARLHRSVRTVDHHVAAVLAKLAVESRLAAVQRAQREGWLAAGGA